MGHLLQQEQSVKPPSWADTAGVPATCATPAACMPSLWPVRPHPLGTCGRHTIPPTRFFRVCPARPRRHEAYDSRADCWSFGVLLVELLTQQKPYSQLYLTPVQVAIQVGQGMDRPAGSPAYMAAGPGQPARTDVLESHLEPWADPLPVAFWPWPFAPST